MTFDDLRALADEFFEWPIAHNKSTVTMTSALLFAQHVLQLREKSLDAQNSASTPTLRDAAQQALEALEWHLDWGTWGADLDGCAAALRAALEQKAEPVPAGYLVSPHGEFKPNFNLRLTFPPESLDWSIPLYTAPPQRKPLTDEEEE